MTQIKFEKEFMIKYYDTYSFDGKKKIPSENISNRIIKKKKNAGHHAANTEH